MIIFGCLAPSCVVVFWFTPKILNIYKEKDEVWTNYLLGSALFDLFVV
jgi:hypothetical protein